MPKAHQPSITLSVFIIFIRRPARYKYLPPYSHIIDYHLRVVWVTFTYFTTAVKHPLYTVAVYPNVIIIFHYNNNSQM